MKVQNYNKYRRISNLLLLLFIGLALLPLLTELQQGSSYMLSRKVIPAVWCGFIIATFLFLPRVHAAGRLSKRDTIYMEAVICAVALIGMRILAGSMLGQLGGSPYDLSPNGILGNLFSVLPVLAAREIIRSYALGTYCNRQNVKAFIFITLLMTVCDMNYARLSTGLDMEGISIFLATEAGPVLCQNIVLSYLALYGGPIAAILYGGILELFHWVSPILSALNWLAEGAVGILIPVGCVLIIVGKYEEKKHRFKSPKMQKREII